MLGLRLAVMGEIITARVSELRSPEALWAGNSDLAELNRATDGRIAAAVFELAHEPLPALDYQSSVMVQQVEVLLSQLIETDGRLVSERQDPQVRNLPVAEAVQRLRNAGREVTLLNVLAELPGRKVIVRLDRALPQLRALKREQLETDRLLAPFPVLPAATVADLKPGPFTIQTRESRISNPGSGDTLAVTVIRPTAAPTLPPVVISHGLWDSPTSFLGWAQHLASHGAAVFLPRHPGSDISQQAEMLAGRVPPPDPREFLRRPADVRAVLDALAAGTLAGGEGIQPRDVVMIGHSWGGTTALQLAGARSLPGPLWKDCSKADNPQRNISWVLQCSFLPAAAPDSQADPRISRVVAVSPPQGLVFEVGVADLKTPVLLVSGSRDFVVPTEPEALVPFNRYPAARSPLPSGLVVAEGGTHFNLPAAADSDGGPLRALLLRWLRGQGVAAGTPLGDPAGLRLRLLPQASLRP